MDLLVGHFNPRNVPEVMCRSLISVGWDGVPALNQMLGMAFSRLASPDQVGSGELPSAGGTPHRNW